MRSSLGVFSLCRLGLKRAWAGMALCSIGFSLPADAVVLAAAQGQAASQEEAACRALASLPNLTLTAAELIEAVDSTPRYCYVKGIISPAIHFHVQLPLPANWNGRFLKWGDGGKDGDLDFADQRLAQGYAVANSNTGHDSGSEPGASFAFDKRQGEIDFGWRAVHLTVQAARTLIQSYYGRAPQYSYFEGCSTGGRQGLMEAQRFPYDFDGIVAGAPVNFYQPMHATRVWLLQKMFQDKFAGNLAFDADGDGIPESLTKLNLLRDAVLAKCDAVDGVKDGVVADPLGCDFKPEVDLAGKMCPGDKNADGCFTSVQIQNIRDIYGGGRDSKGTLIYKGKALGTEYAWPQEIIPHAGNALNPDVLQLSGDHMNFLFYEKDPGVPPQNLTDTSQVLDKKATPPEYAWWEFDIDDVTRGRGQFMSSITDSTDPDLGRFLVKNNGKFLLYHGWYDMGTHAKATLDYYQSVASTTFGGSLEKAAERIRLFLVPGMEHCRGGPGPNTWDKLAPLVEWVEKGKAPESFVATHSTEGKIDNERPVCAYPKRAAYSGPAGGADDPANWRARNFTCK